MMQIFKEWFPAVLMSLLVGGCITTVIMGGNEEYYQTLRQMKWRAYHHCVVTGYTGANAQQVYTCDDGHVYIFRDLPEME